MARPTYEELIELLKLARDDMFDVVEDTGQYPFLDKRIALINVALEAAGGEA